MRRYFSILPSFEYEIGRISSIAVNKSGQNIFTWSISHSNEFGLIDLLCLHWPLKQWFRVELFRAGWSIFWLWNILFILWYIWIRC